MVQRGTSARTGGLGVSLTLLPLIPLVIVAGFFYWMLVIETGSWTPVIHEFRSPPPGYQTLLHLRRGVVTTSRRCSETLSHHRWRGRGISPTSTTVSRGGPDGVRVRWTSRRFACVAPSVPI